MKPQPWSHSKLECHDNCPWQCHEKYVAKNLPEEVKSDEQKWGIFVHKSFETYLTRPGNTLPADLTIHQPFLDGLITEGEADGCTLVAEEKVALSNNPFGVCEYFDKKVPVWWRGVMDVRIVNHREGRARIPDFKTGKKKDDWSQLAQNAIWTFMKYPEVTLVNAQYYWVTDQTITKKVWARSEIDRLVAMFSDKLAAYAQSFRTETFAKKRSGLCKGWCPVTTCEFWEPKKEKHR